jgi:hypothetical protein
MGSDEEIVSKLSDTLAAVMALREKASPLPWTAYGYDIFAGDKQVAGRFDYEDGGIVDADHVALIVAAVNLLPELEKLLAAMDRVVEIGQAMAKEHDESECPCSNDYLWSAAVADLRQAADKT